MCTISIFRSIFLDVIVVIFSKKDNLNIFSPKNVCCDVLLLTYYYYQRVEVKKRILSQIYVGFPTDDDIKKKVYEQKIFISKNPQK